MNLLTSSQSLRQASAAPFRCQRLMKASIRLIRFTPSSSPDSCHLAIQHNRMSSSKNQQYIALSYCWEQPVFSKAIHLNGHLFHITENLYVALQALYSWGPNETYWIDAICIDQNTLIERNEQVQHI